MQPPGLAVLELPCAVYADGGICLDILQNQWSPIYDVAAILTSIQVHGLLHPGAHVTMRGVLSIRDVGLAVFWLQSLLSDPNPNSPANSEAARLYSENRCAVSSVGPL